MIIEAKKVYLRHYLTALVKRELDKLKISYGTNIDHNNIEWKGSQNVGTHDRVCTYDVHTDTIIVRLYLSPRMGPITEVGELTIMDKIDNKPSYRLWINLDHKLFTKGFDRLSKQGGYYAWRCPNLDLYLFEIGAIETENVFNAILLENGGFIYQEDNPAIVDTTIEQMEWNLHDAEEDNALVPEDTMKPKLVPAPGPSKVLLGDIYEDPGCKVMDNQSELYNVKINTNGVVNTTVLGTYTIYYEATDNDGNYMYAQRKVEVVRPIPHIYLNGPGIINLTVGNVYFEEGGIATTWDGKPLVLDIANSYVDYNTVGSYTVTYSTMDDDGNSISKTRTVNIVPE